MYYPLGWARLLRLPQESVLEVEQVVCNRDKILTAVLTSDSVIIWYAKPCVPIISHRRSPASVKDLGKNVLVQWRPDSSMLVVATELGHLIIYTLVVPTDVKTLYELVDPPNPSLRRESDELFVKEMIPPLIFSLAFEVEVEGGVADVVTVREELMIATKDGKILRYSWDGNEIRDYSLDLRRIPFCTDQQVLKAVPLTDKGTFVSKIAYSPLIGGFATVFNDGRAAFLVATTLQFDPNSVTGIWAQHLDDANSLALNHKFKLIAFGRKNSHGVVYAIDDMTGGLVVSHRLVLPTRDFPGNPGPVSCLKWTPDGTALVLAWERGGFSLWSTFGAMIMCSLCWDYGVAVTDPVGQNPLCIKSMDWSAEGYQLWLVNAKTRSKKLVDPDFMPFPEQFQRGPNSAAGSIKEGVENNCHPLANRAMVLQFVKSPISVNPCMTKQAHVYLQGEDKILLNLVHRPAKKPSQALNQNQLPRVCDRRTVSSSSSSTTATSHINHEYKWQSRDVDVQGEEDPHTSTFSLLSSGSKLWSTITIPHSYIGSSWPIRYTAMDDDSEFIAVAGRTGFAHYNITSGKWRLFGNETQEKDFVVIGGLLWWRDHIVMGCYNLTALNDEIRIYPRWEKLDNSFCKVVTTDAQILLLNILGDFLVVFGADYAISIYEMQLSRISSSISPLNIKLTKIRSYDASCIPGLSFHPACVVLVGLSPLKIETHRNSGPSSIFASRGESVPRESSPTVSGPTQSSCQQDLPSLILNVCGRVVMLQQHPSLADQVEGRDSPSSQISLPTVLASGCETIWFPREANQEKPHLTASLWLYCGAHGMRVWLPVFPREGDHGHTFMSKRIMLHFPLEDFYPLAILFEEAIILGAANDTVLYDAKGVSGACLPYSTLERTSLLFLHPILRQLIRRNLGYHAWEIARTCMTLPYFQHCLELLLHEVLEEEATSTEPIPDALLPSVVEFIQEFSVFHQTIGRCARKTEVALWHHLFSVVGSPRALFMECLNSNDLETAASYLLILQNLEPSSVAQNHATLLLDAALERSAWDLAKELTRYLRTIDPEEIEEAFPRPFIATLTPQSPQAMKQSGAEEEISSLLGTLQVPRGRAQSVVPYGMLKVSPKEATAASSSAANHDKLIRSNSESKSPSSGGGQGGTGGAGAGSGGTASGRTRKPSTSSAKEAFGSAGVGGGDRDGAGSQSAEEFYIDVILQRHARRLLSECRLRDLGTFAAQLDFHLVGWLKKECQRAARIETMVTALKGVHDDFSWPYPPLPPHSVPGALLNASTTCQISPAYEDHVRKYSNSSGVSSSAAIGTAASTVLSSTAAGYGRSGKKSGLIGGGSREDSDGISDSGYLSHVPEGEQPQLVQLQRLLSTQSEGSATSGGRGCGSRQTLVDQHHHHQLVSTVSLPQQAIHAMLRPQSFREDLSVLSEDPDSVGGLEERLGSPDSDWSSSNQATPTNEVESHDFVTSSGPQKSEVQLRYLLQMMMESNCLEMAALISVVLKDALALIRIVNAARSLPDNKVVVSRLYQHLKALEAWSQSDCHGYTVFFQAVQPQLNSLRTFLLNQPPPKQTGPNITATQNQGCPPQKKVFGNKEAANKVPSPGSKMSNRFHQPATPQPRGPGVSKLSSSSTPGGSGSMHGFISEAVDGVPDSGANCNNPNSSRPPLIKSKSCGEEPKEWVTESGLAGTTKRGGGGRQSGPTTSKLDVKFANDLDASGGEFKVAKKSVSSNLNPAKNQQMDEVCNVNTVDGYESVGDEEQDDFGNSNGGQCVVS